MLLPKFDVKQFCEIVQKYTITVALVVPPMILGMSSDVLVIQLTLLAAIARFPPVKEYDWSSMKSFLSGGAPLSKTCQSLNNPVRLLNWRSTRRDDRQSRRSRLSGLWFDRGKHTTGKAFLLSNKRIRHLLHPTIARKVFEYFLRVSMLRRIENPKMGSIGFLLPNVEGRIVDSETGKDCKEGEEGEIWLAGPSA